MEAKSAEGALQSSADVASTLNEEETEAESGFGISSIVPPELEDSPRSWPLGLKEEDILIMRVKTRQNNSNEEADVRIPKHEAVCKFCFDVFGNDNVLKTKCKCKFTLIHENCAIEWSRERGNNKCNLCDQDIQNIPVTLSRADEQNLANPSTHPKRPGNWIGCFGGKA